MVYYMLHVEIIKVVGNNFNDASRFKMTCCVLRVAFGKQHQHATRNTFD